MTTPTTETPTLPPPKSSDKEAGGLLAFVAAACVACCIGPILAFLGGVTIIGVASTTVLGATGLLIALTAVIAGVVVIGRRRASACAVDPQPVPIELSQRP